MDQIFSLMAVLILLLITAGVQIYLQQKEIVKHKKTIQKLNEKIFQAEGYRRKNMEEIEKLKWQINNPPKFKHGFKVGPLMVHSWQLHEPSMLEGIANFVSCALSAFYGSHKSIHEKNREKMNRHYVYTILNTDTSEFEKMTESEFTKIATPPASA